MTLPVHYGAVTASAQFDANTSGVTMLHVLGSRAALSSALAALLLSAGLSPAAAVAGGDAPAQRAGTVSTSAHAADARVAAEASKSNRRKFKCGKWRQRGNTSSRYCANVTSVSGRFRTDWTESVRNNHRYRVSMSCTANRTTTWTFSGTVTAEAEAGVIFAKAKTSVSGTVSRSVSSSYGTTVNFPVKARSWAHCKRGTYTYSWTGVVKRQFCSPTGCRWEGKKKYRKSAPTRLTWKTGPGRG